MEYKMVLKDKTGKVLSRSEGEAVMKGRGAITISIYAALLAICTLVSASYSGKVLTNTLKANDTWAFYQAKSIKQAITEMALDDAIRAKDTAKAEDLKAKIARLESDPASGEGKKELAAKGVSLENERDAAKVRSPYLSFASAFLQIAIVLSSTAILAVSMEMLFASIAIGAAGALLLANGIWLFYQIPWL
jgi:Domain of unknown function (DUF4337)